MTLPNNLTIGFDAKRAARNHTGLGNYSRLVLEVLAEHLHDATLRLYLPSATRLSPRLTPLLIRYGRRLPVVTPDRTLWRHLGALWRIRGIDSQLKRDGINLYHGLSNELPLGIEHTGIPSVVTIHDLIFRRMPQCYKPVDRAIYDYKFAAAARAATRVIAISRRTRDDIVEFYGIDPAKIDIVYQGRHPGFAEPVDESTLTDVLTRHGLYNVPYVIGVGTVEQRKNQLLTVKALRGLPEEVRAVIVGRRTGYADEIQRYAAANNLTNRITWLEGIPFEDLPALYRGALAASYPSRYEGFGIPVIEALSAGTPVIVATGSCLEEAGGPDTPAIDPDDADAMTEILRDIIDHPATGAHIVDAGREYIKRFAPGRFAAGLTDCYARALGCK